MAVVVHITNQLAQDRLTAVKNAIDAGTAAIIEIYDGTIPTDADTAVGAQTKLGTLTMTATAFGSVSDAAPGATMTAATITGDSSADATGTAAWARIKTQSGGTTLMDVNVGTSGCAINFNTVSFVSGSTIDITSLVITDSEG
jgi:hypothetical protein